MGVGFAGAVLPWNQDGRRRPAPRACLVHRGGVEALASGWDPALFLRRDGAKAGAVPVLADAGWPCHRHGHDGPALAGWTTGWRESPGMPGAPAAGCTAREPAAIRFRHPAP